MRQQLDFSSGLRHSDESDPPRQGRQPWQAMMEQIQAQHAALAQTNAAVQAVLARIEEERTDVRKAIVANVNKVLMPLLHALEVDVPARHKPAVALLRKSLEEITSPFADQLSRQFANLTPLEIRICRMLHDDLTSKEIAKIRHVSPATIARQRERIRRKLGLTGSDTNLNTFLRSHRFNTLGEGPAKQ